MISSINGLSLSVIALISAIILYGILGSPTPNAPSMVELVLAVLLLMAAAPHILINITILDGQTPLWKGAGLGLLCYGLSISTLNALISGQPISLILRDIFPFLFMLAPLFFFSLFKDREFETQLLSAAFIFAAVMFSARALLHYMPFFPPSGELYYLANAPGVLFSSLILAGGGFVYFMRRFEGRSLLVFMLGLTLAIVPVVAMGVTLQRASLGFFALYLALIALYVLYRYPVRLFWVGLVLFFLAIPFWPMISSLISALMDKTYLHGFNARGEEFSAVWGEISSSPLSLLLGKGWGATFESPAVAGVRVNYTHSFFSAMLLKTGLVGVMFSGVYLYGIGRCLFSAIRRAPLIGLALSGPFFINIFLYASFKSLDFGLLLLLITVWSVQNGGSLQKKPMGAVAS